MPPRGVRGAFVRISDRVRTPVRAFGRSLASEQKTERNKAFDLVDALSRSGALTIDHASLHVVIAATHCFDKTLLDTVIEENVNPIEKVERSLMIVATTVHRQPARELLMDDQRERFLQLSPALGTPTDERCSRWDVPPSVPEDV